MQSALFLQFALYRLEHTLVCSIKCFFWATLVTNLTTQNFTDVFFILSRTLYDIVEFGLFSVWPICPNHADLHCTKSTCILFPRSKDGVRLNNPSQFGLQLNAKLEICKYYSMELQLLLLPAIVICNRICTE